MKDDLSLGFVQSSGPTYGFFEGTVEPAVIDHVLDGDGGALQVLKGIHEDEVEDDVVKVQVLYLATQSTTLYNKQIVPGVRNKSRVKSDSLPVRPALPRCSPSVPCSPGNRSSPQIPPQISLGSGEQTNGVI